jgi:DNA-binding NtrC family response regulator
MLVVTRDTIGYRLVVRADATMKMPSPVHQKVQRWMLRVVDGPDEGKQHVLLDGQVVAIGSSPDNEMRLTDPTVSRYHAEVRMTSRGAHVRDLGSCNGVKVGTVVVHDVVAPAGTRLRLGRTELLIDTAGSYARRRADTPVPVPGLIAVSRAMRDVVATVHQLAPSDLSVLLQGETGTGKEVVARAIHELSPRRGKPFVVVDCASLPANLITSELFGHERGAFTGAEARRVGAFERADGGTLFLDEIGELAPEVQPVLLGALERRRFRRVGGSTEVEVDVRVIAATHRDLREDVNRATFRADLYFRLAVGRVTIPPLRERGEDLLPLASHFVRQITGSDQPLPFDEHMMESLHRHRWTGNVRELRNVVEATLATGRVVLESGGAGHRTTVAPTSIPAEGADDGERKPYREARAEAIARFEQGYLGCLIEECGGNASEAARRARMDRPYLLALLRKHGLR